MKYRLLICWIAFKWMFRINLGDLVWYKGKKYVVLNGVRPHSWKLNIQKNDNDGWVPRNECRKVLTLKNMYGSFKSGYRFYMGYWYDIWKHHGLNEKTNIAIR